MAEHWPFGKLRANDLVPPACIQGASSATPSGEGGFQTRPYGEVQISAAGSPGFGDALALVLFSFGWLVGSSLLLFSLLAFVFPSGFLVSSIGPGRALTGLARCLAEPEF